MSDYTATEVEAALEPILEDDGWYGLADDYFKGNTITLRGESVSFERVDGDAGGEGSAEDAPFVVIKVGDQLFQKTGYYMSHYGTEWDGDFTEVRAVEKMITVYESK